MSASVRLTGVEELKLALRNLPEHLAQEAGGIVTGHAEAAAATIRSRYARKSGELIKGVKVDRAQVSGAGAVARVRSAGRLAFIYEHGSQVRHWKNGKSTGVMPAANIFVPTVVSERRAMVEDLIKLVEREGLVVRG